MLVSGLVVILIVVEVKGEVGTSGPDFHRKKSCFCCLIPCRNEAFDLCGD